MRARRLLPGVEGRARRGFLALAFAALPLLVLQPVCSAYELHLPGQAPVTMLHDAAAALPSERAGHDAGSCCVEIQLEAMAAPSSKSGAHLLPGAMSSNAPAPAFIPQLARLSVSAAIQPIPPPVPQPYYARSARIQR